MLRILHLVDDTNPGGVTRYLDFLATDPGMARLGTHEVVAVPRNRPTAHRGKADLIVSHLAVSWRGLPGLMALRARHAGVPMVHVEHSYSAGFVAANVSARRRFHALLRCAYSLFDRVVAVSEAQGSWLRQRELVADSALTVIRPCVDLTPFRALPAPEGPVRVIGALGRLERQKGFDLLIRAFRAAPDPTLRLRVIGDGPERATLEALAQGDDRIQFAGFASDPATAIRSCDALAMPSRWEPYGLVALEARAARRPVLAAPVDGLRDHGAQGAILVTGAAAEDWTAAIERLASGAIPARVPVTDEGSTRQGWRDLLRQLLPGTDHERATALRLAS